MTLLRQGASQVLSDRGISDPSEMIRAQSATSANVQY